ncbi:hypothetical protein KIPB_002006 [Kipferlia bialata]|uniref:Uncharacterized protein n=1 Tax=Kipferlia bialata TaxID=797122 RepID=A0A9K3GGC9_9EUKA|nr:hypothetical protein KIPB_002006 [Kipferlia bialata]|eukprot:g2006.t1
MSVRVDPMGTGIPAALWSIDYDTLDALVQAVEQGSGRQWLYAEPYLRCITCAERDMCEVSVPVSNRRRTSFCLPFRVQWYPTPITIGANHVPTLTETETSRREGERDRETRVVLEHADYRSVMSLSPTEVLLADQGGNEEFYVLTLPDSTAVEGGCSVSKSVCALRSVPLPWGDIVDEEGHLFELIGSTGYAIGKTAGGAYYLFLFDRETHRWKVMDEWHITGEEGEREGAGLALSPDWIRSLYESGCCSFTLNGCLYLLIVGSTEEYRPNTRFVRFSSYTKEWTQLPSPSFKEDSEYWEYWTVLASTVDTVYLELDGELYSFTCDKYNTCHVGEWVCQGALPDDAMTSVDMVTVGPYLVGLGSGHFQTCVYDTVTAEWFLGQEGVKKVLGDSVGGTYMTIGAYCNTKGSGSYPVAGVTSCPSGAEGMYAYALMVDTLAARGGCCLLD